MSGLIIAGILGDDITDRLASDVYAANPGLFNEAASPPEIPAYMLNSAKTIWLGAGGTQADFRKCISVDRSTGQGGSKTAQNILIREEEILDASMVPSAIRIDVPARDYLSVDILLANQTQPTTSILRDMERRIFYLLDYDNRQYNRRIGPHLPVRNGSGALYDLSVQMPEGCTAFYQGYIQAPLSGYVAFRYIVQVQRLMGA